MKHSRILSRLALLGLSAALLAGSCFASEGYAFSPQDFSSSAGVVFTAVPDADQGTLQWGSRVLRAGDTLSAKDLAQLCFLPASDEGAVCSLSYLPVTNGRAGAVQTLALEVFGKKANQVPQVQDLALETYKNIPIAGQLTATDPEGDSLRFAIVQEPKRGEVILSADGGFTYTPDRNKVGTDSFTFTATDDRDGVSEEAKVMIRIKKPEDRAVFADMEGRGDAYYAMWVKDRGLLTGEQVAGTLCFGPEDPVSRSEFVVLVMRLFDLEPSAETLRTGFSDESQSASWTRPYLSSAVAAGLISGARTPAGLIFRPEERVTEAEAAVILQNLLQLPVSVSANVSDPEATEAWAQDAVQALSEAGAGTLSLSGRTLTRIRCARLLHDCFEAADSGRYGLLSWAAKK